MYVVFVVHAVHVPQITIQSGRANCIRPNANGYRIRVPVRQDNAFCFFIPKLRRPNVTIVLKTPYELCTLCQKKYRESLNKTRHFRLTLKIELVAFSMASFDATHHVR